MRQIKVSKTSEDLSNERGSAIVISLFVLALVTVFAAIALSRASSEAQGVGNETAEARTFYAAQGGLEAVTRNFNKKFEVTLKPTLGDLDDVRATKVPVLDTAFGGNFTFNHELLQVTNAAPVVLPGGPFSGLYAKRDSWRVRTTATDNQGVQVQLTRNVLNNLIPIFQFGIFYDDDLEFHPGPRFDFGGRVHSNGSLFLQAQTGLYFSSKVTAAANIYTDVSKNGSAWNSSWSDTVWVKNASGTDVRVRYNMGSVLTAPVNGPPVTSTPPPTIPEPTAYASASWPANKALFDGNLDANVKELKLPLKLNSDNTNQELDLVEVIKRGKQVGDMWNSGTGTVASPSIIPVTAAKADDAITASERYYNKTGIRVSLADSRQKLPGCATATDADTVKCGLRLDGDPVGQTTGGANRAGYQPLDMRGSPTYTATQVNGNRFFTSGTETWIKVETVIYNPTTELYDKEDITQDILSLGVTEPAPYRNGSVQVQDANYISSSSPYIDSRSILKLQRFAIAGPDIPNTTSASAGNTFASYATLAGTDYNFVNRGTISAVTASDRCSDTSKALTAIDGGSPSGFSLEARSLMKTLWVDGVSNGNPAANRKYFCIAPFPIEMFDTREGLYNDTTTVFNPTSTTAPGYGSNVPYAGVMSMVNIDVANLKKFLDGNFDAYMPTGTPYASLAGHALRGNDIPQPGNTGTKSGGWVFYVSDRRGDFDFDGEYDMEDVFGNNGTSGGTPSLGEDINRNGTLQKDTVNEAPPYTGTGSNVSPDIAATFDHKFYRRGVRLINGETIPGIYDTTTPTNSRGFTVASENGVYVQGNYNATGVTSTGTPTPPANYRPAPTSSGDVPASIAADAITILSNQWNDAESFVYPFAYGSRDASETTIRFAILSGDSLSSLKNTTATANQGGNDLNMNGGVHNFKRFLEDWGGVDLHYCGSLINLFNSHNNNGTYKNGGPTVYAPPDRDWVFDTTFLDLNRLPPGTPYFQYVQSTGFQRTND